MNLFRTDFNAYTNKRYSNFRALKLWYSSLGYRACINYRIQSKVYNLGLFGKLIAIHYRNKNIKKYGVEIGIGTIIGENFCIGHVNGIVIGEGTKIGNNVTCLHQVTFGQRNGEYPIIKDNVMIYPGAKILGNIILESNTIVGANALVLESTKQSAIVLSSKAIVK